MKKSMYVRRKKSDTWHWCKNCSNYPPANDRIHWGGETQMQGYEHAKPNDGEFCNQCLSKGKRKVCRV
jgi:hypothetical protein